LSAVSQILNSPCQNHWEAVTQILRYIKKASRKELLFEHKGNTQIIGYSDVDWA